MPDSDSELDADDFGLTDDWMDVEDSEEPLEEKVPANPPATMPLQLVHGRDYASEAEATPGGVWAVAFKAPTELHPFPEISLQISAPLVPQSRTHSEVWCGTMNDSLELEYMSSRGNILCQCLTSFRPGLVDHKNQRIWNAVKRFAKLNQTFNLEVSKQQSKLNIAMGRLGATAFQCSDQLENMMDISMAVAPFEKAVKDLQDQSGDLVTKNEMLTNEFQNLDDEIQEALIGDVGIKDVAAALRQSAEELKGAREKYLKRYGELNTEVTKHKGRLVQLEQQLTDVKYSATLLKEHCKLLDDNTMDSERHNYLMTKKATRAHDYYYEEKIGDKVVSSLRILREAKAKTTARRSKDLERVMREDSLSAQTKLGKHLDALRGLQQEYTTEIEKRKEAEKVMEKRLKHLGMDLEQKESIYERNLKELKAATENTGVIMKNLPLFLQAFQHILFYNTGVQKVTGKVLVQVQAISDGLDDGLRKYKLWNKPLSKLKAFGKEKLKPMVQILKEQGITECGELAPYHDEKQMQRLMTAILPALRRNHKELLDGDEPRLKIGFEKTFHDACADMSKTPGYLLKVTKDIGGYLGTSFSGFKRGQKLIRKPTAQTLQIELGKKMFMPGREMLAIEDTPVDELKHDSPSSHEPKLKKKSGEGRFID